MQTVVIGFLGSQLDAGSGSARWERWRPTVSICQHEDLVVDRLELLHARQHTKLAALIKEDIASVSPETEVRLHLFDPRDAWDFQEVYGLLHEFARDYRFQPERSEEHTSELQSQSNLVCRLLLEKKKQHRQRERARRHRDHAGVRHRGG